MQLLRKIASLDLINLFSKLQAYASLFKNSLTLYIGKGGELHKVGDFCLLYSEVPNMSEENFAPNLPGMSGQSSSGGASGGGSSSGGSGPNVGLSSSSGSGDNKGLGGGNSQMSISGHSGGGGRERPAFKNGNSRPMKHQMNHTNVHNQAHPYDMNSHNNGKVVRK
jgi:hypothetical protein